MKRLGIFWIIPLLSIALAVFIFTSAHVRVRAVLEETRSNLEYSARLVAWVVQARAREVLASEQHDDAVVREHLAQTAGMLGELERPEVVYVAIQTEQGAVLSSPGVGELEALRDGALLADARVVEKGELLFRQTEHRGAPVLEGLGPFALPGEPTAVLRVGLDRSPLVAVQERSGFRLKMVTLVSSALVLVSIAVMAVLVLLERRRRRAEQRLAEQEADSQHWQMIGEMAATVAHEVRNPLSTVRMAAQRLQREFQVAEADREEYAELIEVMVSESDRVGTVVTEFLELGRPLVLELEELPAAQLLDEALAPLRIRAEQEDKRLQQETSGSALVKADRRRFMQLLGNLVGNALDAVPAQGRVGVRAVCDRDGLHVTIEDSGPGMDAVTLRRITKPFFTTKTRGTGLGLPLAKRLATAHGGSLSFSSKPGEGTQVQLFLPAHCAAPIG